MDRSDLHRLVDTLPEEAFESARRILEHFQVWPPQPPPEMKRMEQFRREQEENSASLFVREQLVASVVAVESIPVATVIPRTTDSKMVQVCWNLSIFTKGTKSP
jgi:hypothetical protein